MSDMDNEIQAYIETTKQESLELRNKALLTGICANCGIPIPPSSLHRGSYTCSFDCHMEFYAKHDYSQNSPAIKEIKRKYKESRKKRENKTSGISVARKEAECTLCYDKILPGEKYSWRIPQPYDDDWDDYAPWNKFKWHVECGENLLNILNNIIYPDEDPDEWDEEDIDEALEYADMNGGIRHFEDNTWHEIPLKKISHIDFNEFNKEVQ